MKKNHPHSEELPQQKGRRSFKQLHTHDIVTNASRFQPKTTLGKLGKYQYYNAAIKRYMPEPFREHTCFIDIEQAIDTDLDLTAWDTPRSRPYQRPKKILIIGVLKASLLTTLRWEKQTLVQALRATHFFQDIHDVRFKLILDRNRRATKSSASATTSKTISKENRALFESSADIESCDRLKSALMRLAQRSSQDQE